MAQLRALAALPEVLGSIPSNYTYSSQPAIMGSNALFWHADRVLLYINKSLKKKNLRNWYASFLKASSVSKYAL